MQTTLTDAVPQCEILVDAPINIAQISPIVKAQEMYSSGPPATRVPSRALLGAYTSCKGLPEDTISNAKVRIWLNNTNPSPSTSKTMLPR